MLTLSEQLAAVPVRELAKLADVAPTTVGRAKLSVVTAGKLPNSNAGRRIGAALNARFGKKSKVPQQQALPLQENIHERIKREELKHKAEAAREKKRKNDEAEGLLLPVDEVRTRLGQGGALLRTGVDGTRRRVEAVCCEKCQVAAVEQFDAGMRAALDAVLRALEGE